MTQRASGQRGAALLSVLLLVAMLGGAVAVMNETMNRAARYVAAAQARDQAYWALTGAEEAALIVLQQQLDSEAVSERQLFAQPFPLVTPLGPGTVRFEDAGRCFNVNSLVAPQGGGEGEGGDDDQPAPRRRGDAEQADAEQAERFAMLVEAVGADRATGRVLAARITDFIDADESTTPGGMEDFDYVRRDVPYRTAGQDLISVSELRSIAGFSQSVYLTLAPYLCAAPRGLDFKININALAPEEAPLLVAASRGAITRRVAEDVLAQRPPQGFPDVETFLGSGVLAGTDLPTGTAERLDVRSARLKMIISINIGADRLAMETLLDRSVELTVVERRMVGGL
ncbi:MAG: type II secretion system minor pseudopilin GspK [Pseudomonadota bacterium]